jgi:hypothetical protein
MFKMESKKPWRLHLVRSSHLGNELIQQGIHPDCGRSGTRGLCTGPNIIGDIHIPAMQFRFSTGPGAAALGLGFGFGFFRTSASLLSSPTPSFPFGLDGLARALLLVM